MTDIAHVRYFMVGGQPVQLDRNQIGAVVTRVLDAATNQFVLDVPGPAAEERVAGGRELTKERFDQLVAELVAAAARARHEAPIAWTHTGDGEFPYRADFAGKTFTLRVNDFPAEPLYTVMAGDRELEDLDDWPAAWVRPQVPQVLLDKVAAMPKKPA